MRVSAHDIIDYVTRITAEDLAWLEDIERQAKEVMEYVQQQKAAETKVEAAESDGGER